MKNSVYTTFFLLVIFVIIFLACYSGKLAKFSEGYGRPLGQLAPYQEQLNECINECNRQDPSRRFQANGNINCGVYCESIMTSLAQRGIPAGKYPITNTLTTCQKQCDIDPSSGRKYSHNEKRKCTSMCYGRLEVGKWCKEMECPYSLDDNDVCMSQCIASKSTNANQVAWTWMVHG